MFWLMVLTRDLELEGRSRVAYGWQENRHRFAPSLAPHISRHHKCRQQISKTNSRATERSYTTETETDSKTTASLTFQISNPPCLGDTIVRSRLRSPIELHDASNHLHTAHSRPPGLCIHRGSFTEDGRDSSESHKQQQRSTTIGLQHLWRSP